MDSTDQAVILSLLMRYRGFLSQFVENYAGSDWQRVGNVASNASSQLYDIALMRDVSEALPLQEIARMSLEVLRDCRKLEADYAKLLQLTNEYIDARKEIHGKEEK